MLQAQLDIRAQLTEKTSSKDQANILSKVAAENKKYEQWKRKQQKASQNR